MPIAVIATGALSSRAAQPIIASQATRPRFTEADGTILGKAHFFDPTQSGDGFL